MKRYYSILVVALALALALPVKGQSNAPVTYPTTNSLAAIPIPTITGGLEQVFDAIKNNTNLLYETHAIYAPGLQQRYGAGVGVAYQISPYVFANTRLEYIDRSLVLPMGNVGLQLPITPLSWLHVTPFIYVGVGFPLSGMTVGGVTVPGQAGNLDPIAITGAGVALRVYTSSSSSRYVDIIGDIEKWSNVPQNEYRLGIAVHF